MHEAAHYIGERKTWQGYRDRFKTKHDAGETPSSPASLTLITDDPMDKLAESSTKQKHTAKNKVFKYIKCLIYRALRNSVNYAQRSGVVMEQYKKYRCWLGSGAPHLMAWNNAGVEFLQTKTVSAEGVQNSVSG